MGVLDRQTFRRGSLSAIRPGFEGCLPLPDPLIVNELRVISSDRTDRMPGALSAGRSSVRVRLEALRESQRNS